MAEFPADPSIAFLFVAEVICRGGLVYPAAIHRVYHSIHTQ